MKPPPPTELDDIFGVDSRGGTPSERASTSDRLFVRSQSQLSPARPNAKGLKLTASSALDLVGYDALREAVQEGAVVISASLNEPAVTLREQRNRLEVTVEQVAQRTGLSPLEIRTAEQPGAITPIRKLKKLAQALGLDDDLISIKPSAGADQDLAVRLRTLKRPGQEGRLSATLVLKLAEAAWTISREQKLSEELGLNKSTLSRFDPNDDYGHYGRPAWQMGYDLAEETRRKLNIDPTTPIGSVRKIIETIGIPLIQERLGQSFAGATVETRGCRGLVVNVEGDNTNPWVRRMTLCHELGHLLWDPTSRLHRLCVDRYSELRKPGGSPVESRANAFAIAFLAPRDAVIDIVKSGSSLASKLSELMSRFGIASTAAKYHLANISRLWGVEIDTTRIRSDLLPIPNEDWETDENWTVDYFPIGQAPIGRRGRFAGLVASAVRRGILTIDSAASYLDVPPEDLERNINSVIDLTVRAL